MSRFAEYSDSRPDSPPLVSLGMQIRPALVGDIEQLALLAQELEGGRLARHRAAMRRFVDGASEQGDPRQILVADYQERLIGFGKAAWLRHCTSGLQGIPEGWYLAGVMIQPEFRRRRVAHELTRARIERLSTLTGTIRYFASARNAVSIALHERFGFVEVARGVCVPGVKFTGGVGVLFGLCVPQFARKLQCPS